MRQVAAAALAVLVLVALPDSARSDTAKSIAEGGAAAAFIGILCSSVALTADDEVDEDDLARRGWLVGVGGSYAADSFEDDAELFEDDPESNMNLSFDNSFGVNGRVGYRCHRYFSAEVEVEWLDGLSADLTEPGFARLAKVEAEPVVITANVKGYFLTGRYQPFLLVGAGVMTADIKLRDAVLGLEGTSENEFALRFGTGIDLYATKHVVVSLETDYVLPFGDLITLDYITVTWGLQYRF